MRVTVSRCGPLRGEVRVPGDKSISIRAVLLGAIGGGTTRVTGWLPADDPLAAVECVRRLGVQVEMRWTAGDEGPELVVHGRGLGRLAEPDDVLDCRGSGTTMRLLAGLLAGHDLCAVLTGNGQLRRRPMERIAVPLRAMGATVLGREGGRLPPLAIQGGGLRGIEYAPPVASAQVKSAVLLAGLLAEGETTVREGGPTRDHTERMLAAMGADLRIGNKATILTPPARPLKPLAMAIPGDFSSAAFFVVAGLLVPGSELVVRDVGVNPTRTGLLDALQAMGTGIEVQLKEASAPEPLADLVVRPAGLRAAHLGGDLVPRMIDEFPILAVAATQAVGETVVTDAQELRVKESNRVKAIVTELRKMGARIEEREDGFVVEGPTRLQGAVVNSYDDHRLAMALAVAGLVADGETHIEGFECVSKSFPDFARRFADLGVSWR